jgi:hypothetical protein
MAPVVSICPYSAKECKKLPIVCRPLLLRPAQLLTAVRDHFFLSIKLLGEYVPDTWEGCICLYYDLFVKIRVVHHLVGCEYVSEGLKCRLVFVCPFPLCILMSQIRQDLCDFLVVLHKLTVVA